MKLNLPQRCVLSTVADHQFNFTLLYDSCWYDRTATGRRSTQRSTLTHGTARHGTVVCFRRQGISFVSFFLVLLLVYFTACILRQYIQKRRHNLETISLLVHRSSICSSTYTWVLGGSKRDFGMFFDCQKSGHRCRSSCRRGVPYWWSRTITQDKAWAKKKQ